MRTTVKLGEDSKKERRLSGEQQPPGRTKTHFLYFSLILILYCDVNVILLNFTCQLQSSFSVV